MWAKLVNMKNLAGSKLKETKKLLLFSVLATVPLAIMAVFAATAYHGSPALAAACQAPTNDLGRATKTFSVTTDDTYRIWSRINVPNQTSNSYLLEVDGNQCFVVGDLQGLASGQWAWLDYQGGNVSSKIDVRLNAGEHTLTMIGREPSVKVDSVLLSADTSCIPKDEGKNCTDTNDTTAPIVELTSPEESAVVAGVVEMTAVAADDDGGSGMQKVEFYINDSLQTVTESEPYTASWNSEAKPDGSYTLRAKAYDAAGNSSSHAVRVTVQNANSTPDTQPPSVPANVSAQALTHEQVKLTWAASTDNVGIEGYRIFRDDAPIADVPATQTSYADRTVAPGTRYYYHVVAIDTIGNESQPSDKAQITTPQPKVTDTTPPTPSANLRTEALSQTQINLYWAASNDDIGVTAYDVYRAKGDIEAAKVSTVNGISAGDTNLEPGTEYRYFVIARDAAGNSSERSVTASARTFAKSSPPQEEPDEDQGGDDASLPCRLLGVCPNDGDYSGVIVGNTGVGILGVKIRVFIDGKQKVYTTDAQGNYRIEGLRTGKYPLVFTHPDYFLNGAWVQVQSGETSTRNVTLLSNNTRSLVNSFWNK